MNSVFIENSGCKKQSWIFASLLLLMTLVVLPFISVNAEYFKFIPVEIKQPDNTVIKCFTSGDEFYHWLHDSEGYTIVQSEADGYFYYATSVNDTLKPSKYKVGEIDPKNAGLTSWIKESSKKYYEYKNQRTSRLKSTSGLSTGVLTNIVIYVRFKNDAEFTTTRQAFNALMNDVTVTSLKGYYNEVSYGKLSVESSQYPTCDLSTNLSYVDINERGYYSPYNAVTNTIGYTNDSGDREQSLVERVINAVKSQIPANTVIDANNDGYVDNVTIVVRGNADGWGKLLWPHQWSLYMKTAYINSKQVGNYIFFTENMFDVSTMCHEMFHVIGAPDLYHYTDNGIDPTGSWSGGITHVMAFMKWKYSGYNWITNIPEITQSGIYSLKPLTSATNNCYKIKSPNYSTEYFTLEFRKSAGFYESKIPGSGLLISRINTLANGNGNGPPDEVYVYRPQGSPFSNGSVSTAHFLRAMGRGEFTSYSNPRCFLSDGSDAGIKITDIAMTVDSVRFTVTVQGNAIQKTSWIVRTDSYENGTAYDPGTHAIDNSPSTIWHTPWSNITTTYPHWIDINFGKQTNIKGFKYLPRQDMDNGRIKDYEFLVSNDGVTYTSVTSGTFPNTKDLQVITFPELNCKYAKLLAKNEVNGKVFASMAEFDFIYNTSLIPKTNWTLSNASSFEVSYDPKLAFDGNGSTFWSSKTTAPAAVYPHEIAINLGSTYCLEGFSYLPRQDSNTGMVSKYEFYSSLDSINWTLISSGTWPINSGEKIATFSKVVCKYIKYKAISERFGGTSANAAEISLYGVRTTDWVAPVKPTNFRIISRNAETLTLSWDKDASDKSILNYKISTPDSLIGYSYTNQLTFNIDTASIYSFSIMAIDGSGNKSDTAGLQYTPNFDTYIKGIASKDPIVYTSNGKVIISKLTGTNTIEIFDILGKSILKKVVKSEKEILSLSNFKGIALVTISKENKFVIRRKLYINNLSY